MEVIVVGGFSEIFEALEENHYKVLGYIDYCEKDEFNKIYWLGDDTDAPEIKNKYPNCDIIITPDMPTTREKLYTHYNELDFKFLSFIHRSSYVSNSVKINLGTFIQRFVHISSNCILGKLVKVNVGVNIMHDCEIGDFTTIAPNAVILGNVKIDSHCYIGANATIMPNVYIGKYATIGAGSVVTKNVDNNRTVKGVPAK